jgi:spore coat protein CotH
MQATLLLHRRTVRLIVAALAIYPALAGTARGQTAEDLFTNSRLHEIRLAISERDWLSLRTHFEDDTYYAADLRWNDVTLRNIGVRSRGKVTRNGVKPGLRVDVNRYLSDQRFLGLTAFALDNAYSDASLLRDRLAMTYFNRLGVAAPRQAHARLYINDQYAGLYVLAESIDRAFIARTFGLEDAHVERGGYLFEYRWVRPYGFEYLGSPLEAYAELFTPQTRQTDSMVGLFGALEEMIRTINEVSDDRFVDAVGEYLDLPLVMRYLAVENFLAESDGLLGYWGLHNFYLYRSQGGRSQFIPWDKDTGFAAPDHPIDFHLDSNVLARRAMIVPELRQIYFDTLMDCSRLAREQEPDSPDSRGWLEREIDRAATLIRDAVAEDPVYPYSLDDFDRDVEWLREFARQRPGVVDAGIWRSSSTFYFAGR